VNGCSEHLSSGLVDNLGERSEVVKGVEAWVRKPRLSLGALASLAGGLHLRDFSEELERLGDRCWKWLHRGRLPLQICLTSISEKFWLNEVTGFGVWSLLPRKTTSIDRNRSLDQLEMLWHFENRHSGVRMPHYPSGSPLKGRGQPTLPRCS
jgi:hypothetical protein